MTALTKQMADMGTAVLRISQKIDNQQVKAVTHTCETCGGPHPYFECPASSGYTQEDAYAVQGSYNTGGNGYQPQGNRDLLSYGSNNFLGPSGFPQNVMNRNPNQNQNRMTQGYQNQGNFNQNQGYQN